MVKSSYNLSCLWLLIIIISVSALAFVLFFSRIHNAKDSTCFLPNSETTEIEVKKLVWSDTSGVSLFTVITRPDNGLVGRGSYLLFYDMHDDIGYTLYEYGPQFSVKNDTLFIFNKNKTHIKRSFYLLSLSKKLKGTPSKICSD